MWSYQAFGLIIESEWDLPELPQIDPSSDVAANLKIKVGQSDHWPHDKDDPHPVFDYTNREGVMFSWPQVGCFRIKMPDLIELIPAKDAKPEYIAFPLLGPVLAWFLHMRGAMVLHGSAVVKEGHTFGFLGDKTAGKSTTAAAFIRAGGQLLTDDLLVVDVSDDKAAWVAPAFAQLKLSGESAQAVPLDGSQVQPLITENFPKRQHRIHQFSHEPGKLDALFVLKRTGSQGSVEWIDQAEALKSLLRFSYNVRFQQAPLELQHRARHFQQCAAVARSTKVGILQAPDDLSRLHETVDIVERALSAA